MSVLVGEIRYCLEYNGSVIKTFSYVDRLYSDRASDYVYFNLSKVTDNTNSIVSHIKLDESTLKYTHSIFSEYKIVSCRGEQHINTTGKTEFFTLDYGVESKRFLTSATYSTITLYFQVVMGPHRKINVVTSPNSSVDTKTFETQASPIKKVKLALSKSSSTSYRLTIAGLNSSDETLFNFQPNISMKSSAIELTKIIITSDSFSSIELTPGAFEYVYPSGDVTSITASIQEVAHKKYFFREISGSTMGVIKINGIQNDNYTFGILEKWKFITNIVGNKAITTFKTTDSSHSNVVVEAIPNDQFDYVTSLYAHPEGSDWTCLEFNKEYPLLNFQSGSDNSFYYYIKKGQGPDPEYCFFKIHKGMGTIKINDVETHFWGFDYPTTAWKYIVATSSGKALLTFSKGTTKIIKVELLSRQGDAKVTVERCSKSGVWSQVIEGNTYELSDVLLNSSDGGIRFSLEYVPPTPAETVGTYPIIFYESNGKNILYRDLSNNNRVFKWNDTYMYEGKALKPIDHDWQKYQTSYFIKRNTAISMELNQTANIFYEIGIQPSETDEMRMIIACAQFGELDLGCIQSISDGYTAKLSAIPIVAYGFSKGFCMDLGTGRDITVQYKRSQPINFDDNSADSRDWSNAKWQKRLKDMVDRWQMRTNGVRLYQFIPKNGKSGIADLGDMTDCYPAINPAYPPGEREIYENWVNAYITGIGNGYAPSKLNVIEDSITFKIGTIYPKPIPYMTVAVTFALEDHEEIQVTVYYPMNTVAPMPYCQAELLDKMDNGIFLAWYIKGVPGVEYQPGDKFTIGNENMIVYAKYTREETRVFTKDEYIPPSKIRAGETYRIYLIGGGGGGGGCCGSFGIDVLARAGGGGGASGCVKIESDIADGKTGYYFEIGEGGDPGSDAEERTVETDGRGKNGNPTSVYRCDESGGNRVLIWSAKGGEGGHCVKTGGEGEAPGGAGGGGSDSEKSSSGGQGGGAGWVLWPPHMRSDSGKDGVCLSGCAHPGYGGAGGQVGTIVDIALAGGGGGGAPYIVGSEAGKYGKGGNGFYATRSDDVWTLISAVEGSYGGGGGGGGDHWITRQMLHNECGAAKGGKGYAVIIGRFNK